jgi:hypothetical protein
MTHTILGIALEGYGDRRRYIKRSSIQVGDKVLNQQAGKNKLSMPIN